MCTGDYTTGDKKCGDRLCIKRITVGFAQLSRVYGGLCTILVLTDFSGPFLGVTAIRNTVS